MKTTIQAKFFINNKTGRKYYVTGTATNTTNAQDQQTMVLYQNAIEETILPGVTFCRELTEFKNKFTEVI